MHPDRIELLEQLIRLERDPTEMSAQLSRHGWDSESAISVPAEAVANVLRRYVSGHFKSEEIVRWANAIECREDLAFSPDSAIGRIIFELANPDLEGILERDRAVEMVRELS